MEFDLIFVGLGIAAAGYFIGNGLKNFKNPDGKNAFSDLLNDDEDDNELIKESHVHYFMGISKEDVKHLTKEYPDIPHIIINGQVYFPKARLSEWLSQLGK